MGGARNNHIESFEVRTYRRAGLALDGEGSYIYVDFAVSNNIFVSFSAFPTGRKRPGAPAAQRERGTHEQGKRKQATASRQAG